MIMARKRLAKYFENYKMDNKANYEIGQALTEVELGKIWQCMKDNKTPGIGITSEVLKVFWLKLNFLNTWALNIRLQP